MNFINDRHCGLVLRIVLLLCLFLPGNASAERVIELTLQEAVAAALQNNLSIMMRHDSLLGAQGEVESEKGVFDPALGAEVMHQKNEQSSFSSGSVPQGEATAWSVSLSKKMLTGTEMEIAWENDRFYTDSPLFPFSPYFGSGYSISLSQPLLKGMGRAVQGASIRKAEKGEEVARFLADSEAADLAAQVAFAYWELALARQDIEVKTLSLQLAEDLLEETRQKIEVGVLAPVDIYQPEAEVAKREENLIAGERNIAVAEDALKLLMNSQDWAVSLVPSDVPQVDESGVDGNAIFDRAMKNRQDIRAADTLVEQNEIQVMFAKNAILPSFAVKGGMAIAGAGDTYGDSFENSIDEGDLNWGVGLVFSMPLGNRSARGRYISAKAELSKARHASELLRQEVQRSVREAVREVGLSVKTITASRKTSLAAKKRLEAEQEKFDVGLSTALDVLEAQESYAQAIFGEKRAIAGYAKAVAEIDRVQGGVININR